MRIAMIMEKTDAEVPLLDIDEDDEDELNLIAEEEAKKASKKHQATEEETKKTNDKHHTVKEQRRKCLMQTCQKERR